MRLGVLICLPPPSNELIIAHHPTSILVEIFNDLLELLLAERFSKIDGNALELCDVNGTTSILIVVIKRFPEFILLLSCQLTSLAMQRQ